MVDRLRFFIFKRTVIHCYECKAEGHSQLVGTQQVLSVLMLIVVLVLTWLTGFLPGDSWLPAPPIRLGSYFGSQYTPYLLAVWWWVALSMLFSPKAHRCSACGSGFIRALRGGH